MVAPLAPKDDSFPVMVAFLALMVGFLALMVAAMALFVASLALMVAPQNFCNITVFQKEPFPDEKTCRKMPVLLPFHAPQAL